MKDCHTHRFSFRLLLAFLTIVFYYGCQPDGIKKVADRPTVSPAQYLENHLYQEAAWEYLKAGDSTAAEAALNLLSAAFEEDYIEFKPLGTRMNTSETYLLTFKNDVKGVFKVENSDTLGHVYHDPAAYKLDQLLGFNFTPYSIVRTFQTPDGDLLRGSLMYFVKECKSALSVKAPRTDRMRFFDAVIGNIDRHTNNWLIRGNGDIVCIDHDRTFLFDHTGWAHSPWESEIAKIKSTKNLGIVYERYKTLPDSVFRDAIRDDIGYNRFDLFLETRKEIIAKLEAK